MGNAQSQVPKEGQGHPEQFYRGVAAAKCGRFTVSEVYFVQALQRHPGRAFWEPLMQVMLRSATKDGEEKKADVEAADGDSAAEKPTVAAYESAWAELQTVRDERHRMHSAAGTSDVATQAAQLRPRESVNTNATVSSAASRHSRTEVGRSASRASAGPGSSKLGFAAAHLYSAKAVEVHLPLNTELLPILDYYRLMADIALTYLELLPTTRNSEKVSCFAARYCLMTIQYTQALLHCLTLWKEEAFGDGLGFLDYEERRLQHTLGDVETNKVAESAGGSVCNTDVATADQRLSVGGARSFTLALAEAHCRYYHVSFLLNYSTLLARTVTTVADAKRKQLIYGNLLDHVDAALHVVWEVAEEYPNDYVGKLIMQNVPFAVGHGRTPTSSQLDSSSAVHVQSLLLGGDPQRHTCMIGGGWSPLQSGLLPLSFARNVRLHVHEAAVRRTGARLLSPAQRMSYHYISWRSEVAFLAVPGCSAYMLRRALPGFVPGKGTMAHQTEMVPQSNASATSLGSAVVPAVPGPAMLTQADGGGPCAVPNPAPTAVPAAPVVTKAKGAALMAKHEKELKRSGRNMNTDLDLSDERTLVMLCQDELAILSLGLLKLVLQLRAESRDTGAFQASAAVLLRMVCGLHGPESPEMQMAQLLLHSSAAS